MWNKVKGFEFDCLKSADDIEILTDCDIFLDYGGYDDPIDDFGIKFMDFLKLDYLIEDFKNFVKKFDYINKNKYENFQ